MQNNDNFYKFPIPTPTQLGEKNEFIDMVTMKFKYKIHGPGDQLCKVVGPK